MKRILLSALCAVFALSCQKDAVEDVKFGPEGQTYFDLSFNASGIAGTKVGLDPTASEGSYLYWTDAESIKLYDASNSYKSYETTYTAPEQVGNLASFAVSDFEVVADATDISILATSGSVTTTTEGVCTVSAPTLALTHDGADYDYDTFGAELPFVSPTATAAVTTTGGATNYTDDAPTLSMLPIFNTLRLSMANIDDSYTTEEVKYITATVTLDDTSGAYFYDSIDITAEDLSYTAGEGAVNAAVTGADSNGVVTGEKKSISSTVTYNAVQTLASFKDVIIPLVSVGVTETAPTNFTVKLEFYTELAGTLVASAEEEFPYATLKYGAVNKVTLKSDSFSYDLNKVDAVTGLNLSPTGVASPMISVFWTAPTSLTNIDTYTLYYAEVDGEVGEYSEVSLNTGVTEYVLGKTNETLAWGKTYSIYVESDAAAGYKDAQCEASQVTTGAQVDIALSRCRQLRHLHFSWT